MHATLKRGVRTDLPRRASTIREETERLARLLEVTRTRMRVRKRGQPVHARSEGRAGPPATRAPAALHGPARDYDEIEKTSPGNVLLAPGENTPAELIEMCRDLAALGFRHAIINRPNFHEIEPIEVIWRKVLLAVAGP